MEAVHSYTNTKEAYVNICNHRPKEFFEHLPLKVVDEMSVPGRDNPATFKLWTSTSNCPPKKRVDEFSKKELETRLRKIRLHNTRKPRVIIKNEGPTLYKLPQQLHKLVNRECLLYIFNYISHLEVEGRRKCSISTI